MGCNFKLITHFYFILAFTMTSICLQVETYHHAQNKLNQTADNILQCSENLDIIIANLAENSQVFQIINYTSTQVVDYFRLEFYVDQILLVNDTFILFSAENFVGLFDIDTKEIKKNISGIFELQQIIKLEQDDFYAVTNSMSLYVLDLNQEKIISENNFGDYITIASAIGVGLEDIVLVGTYTNQVLYWNLTSNENTDLFGESNAWNIVRLTQLNQSTSIASTYLSHQIQIWDVKTKEVTKILDGHSNWITKIMQVKNSNKLISIDNHHQMKVWDTDTGQILNIFNSFESLRHVALTNNQDLLAVSLGGNISMISISTQNQMSLILGQHQKQINMIQQHLVHKEVIITASNDFQLKVWNITNFEILDEFNGTNSISNFIQKPDDEEILVVQVDAQIVKWNLSFGIHIGSWKTLNEQFGNYSTFSSILLNNSNVILVGLNDKIIQLDWETGNYLEDWEIPIINALSFMELPDSQISIGQFSSSLEIYNFTTQELVQSIDISLTQGVSAQIYCSWINLLVVSGYYSGVELRNVSDGFSLITILNGHQQPVFGLSVYYFNGRSFLMTGGWDSQIMLWELQTFTSIKRFNHFPSYQVLALKNSDLVVSTDQTGNLELFSQSVVCEEKQCYCNEVQGWIEWIGGVPVCVRIEQVEADLFSQNEAYLVFQIVLSEEWEGVVKAVINKDIDCLIEIDGWQNNELSSTFWSSGSEVIIMRLDILNTSKKLYNGDIMKVTIPYQYGLIDNKYNLTKYEWTYEFQLEQSFCPLGQYKNYNGDCKEQVELNPRVELTDNAQKLKLQFFNDEKLDFLLYVMNYITVESVEGYSKNSYTYTINQSEEEPNVFYIDFDFQMAIINNPLTTILIDIENTDQFLSGQIKITQKVLEINLMNKNDYNEEVYNSMSTFSSSCYYGVYAGSVVSGLSGSTSALSSFFILGLIELLKFQRLNYEEYVWKFFEPKNGFVMKIKKLLKITENNLQDKYSIPSNLTKYNISCYFFNNFIFDMLQIITLWVIALIVVRINKHLKQSRVNNPQLKKSKIRTIFKKIYKTFVWNIVYLFLFKSFLNGWVFAWIEIFHYPVYSPFGKFNYVLANIVLIFLSYLIMHVVIISRVKQKSGNPMLPMMQTKLPIQFEVKKQCNIFRKIRLVFVKIYESGLRSLKLVEKFAERHKIILGEEKKESVLIKYNFLEFELIRIFYITLVMIALQKYVLLQAILNILFMMFYYLNLMIKGLKNINFFFVLQLIVEFFIIVAYSGAFLFAQYKINGKANNIYVEEKFQQLIVLGIVGVTACQLIAVVASLLKSILNFLAKIKKEKEIKRIRVLEIESPEMKPTTPLNFNDDSSKKA